MIAPSGIDRQQLPGGAPRAGHSAPAPSAPIGLRVWALGPLLAGEQPGGGETQMHATLAALTQGGHQARPWRPWEEQLAQCDLVHLFGTVPQHLAIVAAAHRARRPVVLSPVAWYSWRAALAEPRPAAVRAKALVQHLARAACPVLPSWRKQLYQSVDRLLPNSQCEAAQLTRHFLVSPRRLAVVPNGADARWLSAPVEPTWPWADAFGLDGIVLYCGRIEPRKNQLGFLQAMRGSGLPIVVLGDPVPGYEAYAQACRRAADARVRFLPRLPHGSAAQLALYRAARCLALVSYFETPGLVALEAGLWGVPLVLPAHGAAREYFGACARYVSAGDQRGIRQAVCAAFASPRSAHLANLVRSQFTWEHVARATLQAYAQVL